MNSNVLVARKERGITQEGLATAVKVNHADIVRIEKHGWIPPAVIRQRLAEVLERSEEELFGDLGALGKPS